MSKKIAMITGVTGQDGSYLSELLLSKGYEVHGTVRRSSSLNRQRIDHLATSSWSDLLEDRKNADFVIHYADLTDAFSLARIIDLVRPDEVYNLAAQSHVRISFDQPSYTVDSTGMGVLHILEAIRHLNRIKPVKFYQASSSEMFGSAKPPQNESTPFHPRSPYSCAKLYGHWQTINYRESYDMFNCSGILFNHESPRRGENFVTRKITRGATRIKEGLQTKLTLGNLDARRDWGFAGDYVQAMWMMLQQDTPDDYVIATGEAYSVREFLDATFSMLNLDYENYVEFDSKFSRPAEVDFLLGDSSKARTALGWSPTVDFGELVTLMVDSDWELAKRERRSGSVLNGVAMSALD